MAFLPMHLPVMIAGILLAPCCGGLIGLIVPLVSSILTGMPPVPKLYFMLVELAAYGIFTGIFIRKMNVYLTLLSFDDLRESTLWTLSDHRSETFGISVSVCQSGSVSCRDRVRNSRHDPSDRGHSAFLFYIKKKEGGSLNGTEEKSKEQTIRNRMVDAVRILKKEQRSCVILSGTEWCGSLMRSGSNR